MTLFRHYNVYDIMGLRGAPTTCLNQHGASRSYSFRQIWADREWIFVLIPMWLLRVLPFEHNAIVHPWYIQHMNWTYCSQRIIQNKHAQIICNIRPNRFSSHLWLFVFFKFWIICTDQLISQGFVLNENKTVLTDSLSFWALSTVCLGIW